MRAWWWLVVAGCAGGDPDPPVPEGCMWDGVPALEVAQDLSTGAPMDDGDDVAYGTPPQGGAAYAPFQVRLHGTPPEGVGERWPVTATAYDAGTGDVLGEASQPQAFFCANTGVHDGWLFGGEVHVRFPGVALEDLQDRPVDVALAVVHPDGDVVTEVSGVLRWRLGPGAP